ncbi:hypothetical protein BT96DRAFT_346998 [Gymnopus androsaceus JB14]|uniref:Uncharacterized protein n=1 Tax=Gymnopus androsaceus JB14 TaxID=1447944 RepID=A0A6A4I878_9AGAR|nr:hypothetical protein BT96DRAFT_346998 [Gymnopus androsaceus JB14]
MTYTPFNSTIPSSTSQITALACNMTVDMWSNKAFVDPISNALLGITGEVNKTSSISSPFPAVYRSTPLNASSPAEALLDIWGVLPTQSVSPLASALLTACTESNTEAVCGTLYQPEQFVMESLNIFPDILLDESSSPSIGLTDLENVLARMTAIEFWAEGQGNNLKFANALATEGVAGASTNRVFTINQNTVQIQKFFLVFAINRIHFQANMNLKDACISSYLPPSRSQSSYSCWSFHRY